MARRGDMTSLGERLRIRERAADGATDAMIADELRRSIWTVRKWRRRGQRGTMTGLATRIGRPPAGPLSTWPAELKAHILDLRRTHPGWGALTILVELQRDPVWNQQRLPSRARIGAVLQAAGLTRRPQRHTTLPEPVSLTALYYTKIGSNMIQKSSAMVPNAADRQPYCLPPAHRTPRSAILSRTTITAREAPWRARGLNSWICETWCANCVPRPTTALSSAPPASTAGPPTAIHSGRPYRPEWEENLLDMSRVGAYLAGAYWVRQGSPNGAIGLGGTKYWVGPAIANQGVKITFDPAAWCFMLHPAGSTADIILVPQGLTKAALMGAGSGFA